MRRWNSNIYPNVSLMSQFQQLRVVHPIAVDRTVVQTYSFRLKGAPEQMFRNTISFANIVNGTGSLVLTDDLEIYNRIDLGLSSEGAEWLQIGRGYQSDVPDAARRPARRQFDQRGLHPQHARRLARLHERRPRQAERRARGVLSRRWRSKQKSRPKIAAPEPRAAPSPLRGRAARPPPAPLDLHRCEQFLLHEARLLDEAKFDDWLALFTADGWYWVPSEPGPGQPARHRVADLRRPAAAGDAGAAAREPAHVFAGAALALQPHRRQRHDRGDRCGAAASRCARNS